VKTRKIGSLEVTVAGLGCNNFGWRLDYAASEKVVHAALDAGINFFDTADIYGATQSELFLGRALKGRKAIIATKFGMEVSPDKKGAKPDYVKRACEDSLERLGVERIDLYQLHTPDNSVPLEDTIGALKELQREGKVLELGCSNFSAALLKQAGGAFTSVQNQYSVLHRGDESDALPEAEREGIAYLPFFPLESGLLSGKYSQGKEPEGARLSSGGMKDRFRSEEKLARAEKLRAYAESRGHTLLELAFAYLLAHRSVSSVIAGATKAEQAQANAAAVNWELSADELKAIQLQSG
jgi:aryl-alcohol dehydrogenase-like predicted oxidoreductase